MSEITSISITKRDPTRASIKVDGRFVAALPLTFIERLKLKKGDPWSVAIEEAVSDMAAFDKAYRYAMRVVNRRAISRREMMRKLKQKEHVGSVAEAVCDRLEHLGAIDDRAYAEAILRELRRSKPAGPMLMKQKLFQKGIDQKLIDELVAESTDPDDQVEAAVRLIEKRLSGLQRYDSTTQKRRLWSALQRRGFFSDTIERAMSQFDFEADDSFD